MNPGLVVKLRPAGPWRIGPDSGARNRVDVIYHSDSLYSAVTSAMSRMGSLDVWLNATARSQTPAVCFSSCFPFIDDIGFVVPPRTIWPPTSPAAMSARVRWKSARFIPLSVVESILSGKKLNDNQWSVDGASGCLVPAGKPGPFRTSVRWNAAVDRLSGASERHATACIEFREGCGLWTVVGFPDDAARDQWQEPVKAAFRLLADTGFGGERSRGWGRSETPEFVEGTLPGLVIEYKRREPRAEAEPSVEPAPETAIAESLVEQAVPPAGAESPAEALTESQVAALEAEPSVEPAAETAIAESSVGQAVPPAGAEPPAEALTESQVATPEAESPAEPATETAIAESLVGQAVPPAGAEPPAEALTESQVAALEAEPVAEPAPAEERPEAAAVELVAEQVLSPADAVPSAPAPEPEAPIEAAVRAPSQTEPMRVEAEPPTGLPLQAHWLLSLFTPAADDAVDWARGSYTVLARGGRIDSPSSGSGELKKQIQMVSEGSVLYADGVPLGAAADVAPDGFAHPVFRAGFALAIPLPEVH